MRRLTLPRQAAQTDDAGTHRERGAVAVLTAILMVVLLGFAALAVDGGMLFARSAELQSGADAASIAVAQRCAVSTAVADCSSSSPLASSLAQSNSDLGQNGVATISIDTTARTVTATTQPLDPDSQPGSVSLFLARALGFNSATVGASAKAAWGSPSAGLAAFPMTFSVCQLQGTIDGAFQVIQSSGSGVNPSCTYGTLGQPGQVVPGGFGWLTQNSGQCGASINVTTTITGSGQPGNSAPSNCGSLLTGWISSLQAGQRVVVLLPVFTYATGTGNGAVYTISGFAAFSVIGWNFGGNTPNYYNNTAPNGDTSLACANTCKGIIGKFITFVALDNKYDVGPSTAFGATIVRLAQ